MPNEAESTTSSESSAKPKLLETLAHKSTRQWAGLRFLYDMIMQDDARKMLADNRKLANRWNNQNLAGSDGANAMPAGGEDMGDMIAGDQKIINHHHHYPTQAPAKSKLGTIGKLALAGGLLATGIGAGAAIPLIISALKPAPVVVQPQPVPTVDTDTDTSGEIMLWPPKGKQ